MTCWDKNQHLCSYCSVELNLNDLPNNAIIVSGFSGEDGGIVKLNAVS
jgi:hypothetical protein